MALFKKKLSLAEILEGIENLSEEEKAQVTEKLSVPTEEKPVETVEENANDNATEETGEAVENEEVAQEGGEVEETTEEVVEETPIEEPATEETPTEEPLEQGQEMNEVEEENKDDVIKRLSYVFVYADIKT